MNRGICSRFRARVTSAALLAFVAATPAFAQDPVTFDPAPTLTMVTSATTFITAVGLAVLGLIMLAKGIKWVRKAG